MPWVWDFVEVINSFLFRVRYGGKLRCVENGICHMGSQCGFCYEGYEVVPIREIKAESLVEFLLISRQRPLHFLNHMDLIESQ